LECTFDSLRRDVLPAAGLDQVLLSVGDAQISVSVQLPDVARVEPALPIDDLGGGLGHPEIAEHDLPAALEDLAVRGNLHLDAGKQPPDCPELVLAGQIDAGNAERLREAVAFQEVEAEQVEEARDLVRQRSAARHEGPDPAA